MTETTAHTGADSSDISCDVLVGMQRFCLIIKRSQVVGSGPNSSLTEWQNGRRQRECQRGDLFIIIAKLRVIDNCFCFCSLVKLFNDCGSNCYGLYNDLLKRFIILQL